MSVINFSSEISRIKKLISEGNYTTALKKVEPLLSLSEISNEEKLTCKLAMINIQLQSGNFKQVITLTDALYNESIALNELIYAVDAYTLKITALWRLGMFDEGLQTIDHVDKLLEQIKNISYKEVLERKATFYLRRGTIYANKGELDTALENTFKSLALYEELVIKRDIARSYNNIGQFIIRKGDLKEAIEYFKKAIVLSLELNHKESQATTYHNIGYTFYLKGDLDIEKEYFEKSLILSAELGLKHFVSL